jgi:hypothetical protein
VVDYHQDQKPGQNFFRILGKGLKGKKEVITLGQRGNDYGPIKTPSLITGNFPRAAYCS